MLRPRLRITATLLLLATAHCGARSGLDDPLAPPDADVPTFDATPLPSAGTCVLLALDTDERGDSTWLWNDNTWTEATPSATPSARINEVVVTFNGTVLLFGGASVVTGEPLDDTWVWNGETWTEQHPARAPSARQGAVAFALDGRVVMFGGRGHEREPLDETWSWDGTTWTREAIAPSPSARQFSAAAVLDSTGVLFGGLEGMASDPVFLRDTWTWTGAHWTEVQPSVSPGPREGAMLATLGDHLVLFGGSDRLCNDVAPCFSNDTWTWDGAMWTEEEPATSPSPRAHGAAGVSGGVMVLFGGQAGMPYAGVRDTWTWNGATWTEWQGRGPEGFASSTTMGCY